MLSISALMFVIGHYISGFTLVTVFGKFYYFVTTNRKTYIMWSNGWDYYCKSCHTVRVSQLLQKTGLYLSLFYFTLFVYKMYLNFSTRSTQLLLVESMADLVKVKDSYHLVRTLLRVKT